jgi:hypothetical protein
MGEAVCRLAASLIDDTRAELEDAKIVDAVRDHDTPTIFDWLLGVSTGPSDLGGYSPEFRVRRNGRTPMAIRRVVKGRLRMVISFSGVNRGGYSDVEHFTILALESRWTDDMLCGAKYWPKFE